MRDPNLRLYTFVNALYMREIQHGIQTHHVAQELVNKYVFSDSPEAGPPNMVAPYEILKDWSLNHKTDIVLNGGNQKALRELKAFLEENRIIVTINEVNTIMPFAFFHEDEDSLDGILTAIGIVLPEHLFDAVNYRTFLNTVPDAAEAAKHYDRSHTTSWFWLDEESGTWHCYEANTVLGDFITKLKNCGLAR